MLKIFNLTVGWCLIRPFYNVTIYFSLWVIIKILIINN